MLLPYIGVTGFTTLSEITAALQVFPRDGERQLMVGVLATGKSLRSEPMKPRWRAQTPEPSLIAGLFLDDPCVLNLVHYSLMEGKEDQMLANMNQIHDLAGPNFHGFQLNIAWPDVGELDKYRVRHGARSQIVLQISNQAVEDAGGTPKGVADRLAAYEYLIDGILLDPSGGLGKAFDTEHARTFLREIEERGWDLGLGVAGGLGPHTLHLVLPLIKEFPELSIDAQGQLRNQEEPYELGIGAMQAYLDKSLQLFF